jgi:hypothetical protein
MLIASRLLRRNKITIFNAITKETENDIRWQATVIDRARVDTGRGMMLRDRGVESSDKALLFVELRDYTATGNRTYITAKSWDNLCDKDKLAKWTIKPNSDFWVLGDMSTFSSKEELMNKCEVFSVTDVMEEQADNNSPIILRATARV